MTLHLSRLVKVAFIVAAAAVPAWLTDPAAKHLIDHLVSAHPWLAVYFPGASGLVYAIVRAYNDRRGLNAITPASGGSDTMAGR